MKTKRRLYRRSQSGIVFAELALVIAVLVFIALAIFEIGRAYHIQNNLEYSAKQAARIGASIREGVDQNFMSRGMVSKSELENLIFNSVKVRGIVEDKDQFMIRYLNMAGNEVMGIQDLPFDRQNNPGSIEFIEVTLTYPGPPSSSRKPIPAVLDPGNFINSTIFPDGGIALMSRAVFKIEGRFEQ